MSHIPTETHPAIAHLTLLFEPTDRVCLTFIHSNKKTANGDSIIENHCLPIEKVVSEKAVGRMQAKNDTGLNTHAAMNPVQELRRRARLTLTQTTDGKNSPESQKTHPAVKQSVVTRELSPPAIIQQSSSGMYQSIWKLNPADFTSKKVRLSLNDWGRSLARIIQRAQLTSI